jgi:cellulose biosynthesis protein BcsQ
MSSAYAASSGPLVVAFTQSKGGVGKSYLAQLCAIFAQMVGYHVELVDLDGNPGQTAQFCHFLDLLHQQQNPLQQQIQRDPVRRSVQGLLLRPENGIEGIALRYPLREVLTDLLPRRPRFEESQVDSRRIAQQTIETYGVQLDRLGTLTVIPNSGSFQAVLAEIMQRAAGDPSFDADQVLARALSIQEQVRAQQGEPPMQVIVLDVGGERGVLPNNAYNAATHVVLPFTMDALSVDGLLNTIEDVRNVQRRRNDPARLPIILPAVPNQYHPRSTQRQERWVQSEVATKLGQYGATVMPHDARAPERDLWIPFSVDLMERASLSGLMPFEYNPLDPAVQAVYRVTRQILHQAFG